MFVKSPQYPIAIIRPRHEGSSHLLDQTLVFLDVECCTEEPAKYRAFDRHKHVTLLSPKELDKFESGKGTPVFRRPEQIFHALGEDQIVLVARKKASCNNESYFDFQGERFFLGSPENLFVAYGDDDLGLLRQESTDTLLGENNIDLGHDQELGLCFLFRASRRVELRLTLAREQYGFVNMTTQISHPVSAGVYNVERFVNQNDDGEFWLVIVGTTIGISEKFLLVFSDQQEPAYKIKLEEIKDVSGFLKTGDGVIVIEYGDGRLEAVSDDIAIRLLTKKFIEGFSASEIASGYAKDVSEYSARNDVEQALRMGENLPLS